MIQKFDKIRPNASTEEITAFLNKLADKLDYAMNNIDENNLTQAFRQRLKGGD